MKYEVNASVIPTQVGMMRKTYCFYLKSVMEQVEKCISIDEVQELLLPAEKAIYNVLKMSCRLSIDVSAYGMTPRVSHQTRSSEYLFNEYHCGILYVTVLSYDSIDCVKVDMQSIEESVDANKGEE